MKDKYKNYICFGLVSFMVVLPFVVRLYVAYPEGLQREYFAKATKIILDYFTYYKQWIVVLVSVVALFLMFFGIFGNNGNKRQTIEKLKLPMITLGISMLLYIISAMNAKEKSVLLFGLFGECEGLPAILSYSVLFFAGYTFFQTEKSKKILKYGLIGLMTILIVVCVFEYLGHPIYNWDAVLKWILPKEYWMYREEFKIGVVPSMVSAGMESSGYLGGLCVLLFPISIGFAYEEKNKVYKGMLLLISGGLIFVLIAANSTGALIAAIASAVGLCIIYRKTKRKLLRNIGGLIVVCFAVFLIINGLSYGAYGKQIMSTMQNKNDYGNDKTEKFVLEKIQLKDGMIEMKSKNSQVTIAAEKDANSSVEDIIIKEGKALLTAEKMSDGKMRLTETGYEMIAYWIEENVLYLDLGYQEPLEFFLARAGLQYITFNGTRLNDIPQPQTKDLEWLYPICTGRGYAWVNSIPILKECVLVGKGVANFSFAFPQSEVAGMLNTHGSTNLVIEKAHNWYLQIAIDSGLLSLISILVLFGTYIVKGAKRYMITVRNGEFHAFFVGLLAFMFIGLINNSSISVNPIFWLLFGICYYQLGTETSN